MTSSAFRRDMPDEVLMVRPSKWTLIVVTSLRNERLRFNELRRSIGTISQKILTTTLRELERDGFVSRTLYATIPPRVEYELTDLGQDLLELADQLEIFFRAHRAQVEEARRRFDAASHSANARLVISR
ncbi:winged helix-turn-helix transcriptional regulator [Devosia nitrariae]|uniref:HxlR family transcriptional regulator n=1 Tax=Devosia nitrariae TaxID=2071872 RepID=A0ABQ5W8M5_9HYPH|nr:helix-turn-helix domain-containing protein [Devosia nitrariae]GLQ55981.1 HxlR family transcriptional regulator [Devosia nitrariae]